MLVLFHRTYVKKYRKLEKKPRIYTDEKMRLFEFDPNNPALNNHSLHGKWIGYGSINITGDLRAIYKNVSENTVMFVDIDTHSNLYK